MAQDKYGNELPVSPGYKRIVGPDGVPLKEEETIFIGDGITVTAVAGGTQLEGTGIPAEDATAAGLALLGAATAAAQAALLAPSLGRVVISAAAISGSSASASWTAGAYRRIEVILRCLTGNAADPTLVFAGTTMTNNVFSSNANLSNSGATGAGTGTWTQADQYQASAINLTKMGQSAFAKLDAYFTSNTTEVIWTGRSASGLPTVIGGSSIGATGANVSGLTVTFGGATTGYLEVIGYP